TIVEGKAKFTKWGDFSDIEIMTDWNGKTGDFTPDFKDADYVAALTNAMNSRVAAVEGFNKNDGGYDKLPAEALNALKKVVSEIKPVAAAKKAAPAKAAKAPAKKAPAKKTTKK
ncbi:MAG: hypothetical protein IKS11_07440, partial [Lachnospiraceae bacterium]|nr:hypothetical protein [Lachnospiraceae bacterium]